MMNVLRYIRASVKKLRVLYALYREFFACVKAEKWSEALNIRKRIDRVKYTI